MVITIQSDIELLAEKGWDIRDSGVEFNAFTDKVVSLFPDCMGWDFTYETNILLINRESDRGVGNEEMEAPIRDKCSEFGEVINIERSLW